MDLNAEFNKYQAKYLVLNRDAVIDKMVEDGVITPKDADKLKSEKVSAFEGYFKPDTESDFDIKNIMGADFHKDAEEEPVPDPQCNRQIEPTFQSNIQGDCWLLSDVNALNTTDWGKQLLHDCIVPDENGDVVVKFKGSPLPQKNFRITPQEIDAAKKKGTYSSGDDDMIALELATEKVLKGFVEAELGERIGDFDDYYDFLQSSYLVGAKYKDDPFRSIRISDLLTGVETVVVSMDLWNEDENRPVDSKGVLKFLAENPEAGATVCTFNHRKDAFELRDDDDPVHGNHAYAIKNIDYGKSVTVVDPYHADKEIKLSWSKFIDDVETLFVSTKDETDREKILNARPEDYEKNDKFRKDDWLAFKDSMEREDFRREQEAIERKIQSDIESVRNSTGWRLLDTKEISSFFYDDYKYGISNKLNKDNIVPLLNEQPEMVIKFDKCMSGLGNGDRKKELIAPIINALAEKAAEVNVPPERIKEFKDKCFKELDAHFYTDEKVIQAEVEAMLKLVDKE